ncbi:sulfate ABC transporter permease subunit CysT [Alicyclobacillus contaminans]|uniref:sulfate ABC transporter permease subunit CysT n=1 Tax=Alicyclobacillus contaminans TaxID=392016 RepID=UPI00041433D9|nr:sulfate ABC transporter permease subunit CysT [Alicyclobacillus contaminans]GMA49860.1 sulfate ABC transporter permease subunit CysT [Alicyclobacillus contaminans]
MKTLGGRVTFLSVGAYALLLIVLPVASIFQQAFAAGWGAFAAAVVQPMGVAALRLTLETALLAAVINTVAGTVVAYVFERMQLPGRSILNALVDLPFAVPTTVGGLMLVFLYGPASPVGAWFARHGIQLIYSPFAIVLAMMFVTLPYSIRTVQPILDHEDARMEEAAYTLGASPARVFWSIVLPTLRPGILSGFALTFSRALAEFGAVVIVSGNLPMHTQISAVYLYGLLENYDTQGAAAVSVVLLVLSLLAMVAEVWLQRRERRGWRQASVVSTPGQAGRVIHDSANGTV